MSKSYNLSPLASAWRVMRQLYLWAWNSWVSMSGYRLDRLDPRQRQRISSGLGVQTNSEAHPAFHLMGTGGHLTVIKSGWGVALTIHPIQCRGQERVGTTFPLSSGACIARSGTALILQVYPLFRHAMYYKHVSHTVCFLWDVRFRRQQLWIWHLSRLLPLASLLTSTLPSPVTDYYSGLVSTSSGLPIYLHPLFRERLIPRHVDG
jgi:hypothetical protein